MYEKFINLPEEKRSRIINECMKEFALKGYRNASTNVMTKNAGISKGLLFHYFGSKKQLYCYLFEYGVELITKKLNRYTVNVSKDLFEMVLEQGYQKLRIAAEEPLIYKLLFENFIHTPKDLKKEITHKFSFLFSEQQHMFYEKVDTSKFRKGIDPKKAIDIIYCFIEGMYAKHLNKFKEMEPEQVLTEVEKIHEETREYLDILKYGIYEL